MGNVQPAQTVAVDFNQLLSSNNVPNDYSNIIQHFKEQLKLLESDILELRAEMHNLKDDNNQLRTDIAALENKLENVESLAEQVYYR